MNNLSLLFGAYSLQDLRDGKPYLSGNSLSMVNPRM